MNLSEMRALVRKDLHDEDDSDYRWTDDELNRCIGLALKELAEAIPLEQKAVLATTAGLHEIDISTLTGRVMVEAVEYPLECNPAVFQRFSVWGDTLTLQGEMVPDGSNCQVYYGKLHT